MTRPTRLLAPSVLCVSFCAAFASPAFAAGPATAPAADNTAPGKPDAALKDQGLSLVGDTYVLPGEREVAVGIVNVRKLKKNVDDVKKTQAELEKRIRMAKGAIADGQFEIRKLNDEVAKTPSGAKQNQLIARINSLTLQIDDALKYKNQAEEDINKNTQSSRQEYVEAMVGLSTASDATVKRYDDLAADPAVKAVIDAQNAAGKKVKLGPSTAFVNNRKVLDKMQGEVLSENIDISTDAGVPMVEVILNGKYTRTMVVDSGASVVCLPSAMATELGMKPTDQNPTVKLQLADGKVVEGKMMQLHAVQVGKFKVENVDCAVLPPDLVAAQPLLGGSFLSNFTYKVDTTAKKLHLIRVGQEGDVLPTKPDAAKKPPAKAAPAKDAPAENKDK